MGQCTEIMWIESKAGGLRGPARKGRVTYSKSGRSLTYGGKTFNRLKGRGFKSNHIDVETGDGYWISGCRKDGGDALYPTTAEIDDEIREEYWTVIPNLPENKDISSIKAPGKY